MMIRWGDCLKDIAVALVVEHGQIARTHPGFRGGIPSAHRLGPVRVS